MPFTLYHRLVNDQSVTGATADPYRPAINTHSFFSVLQLRVRGTITTAQAQSLIGEGSRLPDNTPVPLDADEVAQVTELAQTVTVHVITGSTANEALGRARRAERMDTILAILTLVNDRVSLLDTPAKIEAMLEVPAH